MNPKASKTMKSAVYFAKTRANEPVESTIRKIKQLWEEAGFNSLVNKDDFVAVKLHLGEEGGVGYIKPHFVRPIIAGIKQKKGKPFLTETATLYLGKRNNAIDHLQLAYEHGFTFENIGCPVIMGDGLRGEYQVSVKTESIASRRDKSLSAYIHLAGITRLMDVVIGLAHPTGHLATGYGGAIKNIGMGLASRGGKLAQHSGAKPQVLLEKCQGCGICLTWCPAGAISNKNDKMRIDYSRCFGCGECFSVCNHKAIKILWDESSVNLQKKMVDYTAEILKGKKVGFLNFAVNITKQCDCMGDKTGKPITEDLGILVSADLIALDQATIDLINRNDGQDVFKKSWPALDYNIQLAYGEETGLGSRSYQLKEVK